MRDVEQMSRLHRIKLTKGMPLMTIIEKQLVSRLDWVSVCGAVYPDQSRTWHRHPNGFREYIGARPRDEEGGGDGNR